MYRENHESTTEENTAKGWHQPNNGVDVCSVIGKQRKLNERPRFRSHSLDTRALGCRRETGAKGR